MTVTEKENTDLMSRIKLLAVIFGVILPLINNFGLTFLFNVVDGDIAYETLAGWLDGTISALNFFSVYILFALLINSDLRFDIKRFPTVFIIMLIRLCIVYAASFVIPLILVRGFTDNLGENLATLGVNLALEVVLILIVVGVTRYLKRSYADMKRTDITLRKVFEWNNPLTNITFWAALMISVVSLAGLIANALGTKSEGTFISRAFPYVKWVISSVAGYFVMHFTALYLQKANAASVREPEKQ